MSSDGKGTADPPTSKPGEGIRSIRTTNLFQIINFELYAKPNIVIMGFGLVALALSGAYLAYLKATISQSKTYIAIDEDGTQTLQEKRSKWV